MIMCPCDTGAQLSIQSTYDLNVMGIWYLLNPCSNVTVMSLWALHRLAE